LYVIIFFIILKKAKGWEIKIMRISKMFLPTLREVPKEAEIPSHQLMLRAGLIKKLASGVYAFLPIGYKIFKKIEQIIREEMDNEGAHELIMSSILPSEFYLESGRWDVFGPEMFKFKDRNKRDFCLGPTHEEVFTDVVKGAVNSYKALPLILYQIQTKFRDEIRPRFGIIRSREFVMKDAYSFDKDEKGLDSSYKKMHKAYCKIFDRLNLDYTIVEADSGAMGGQGSEEFMVKSKIGEGVIAYCERCGYAANEEKAQCVLGPCCVGCSGKSLGILPIEKVSTPNVRTIEELTKFFNCSPFEFAKTLIYKADDKYIAVMVRGDREINETKLQNYLGCSELMLADTEEVMKITSAEVGFAGPIGLNIKIIVDPEVEVMKNFIVGANETGYHFKNVNILRDFKFFAVTDIRNIVEGDKCPKCGFPVKITRGIEVGHIFKLGTKYSKALDCTYLDENGKEQTMVMGSYGIGVGRTMAAIIEQNYDENGIIWPLSVAPYSVIVVPVNQSDKIQVEIAEGIYSKLIHEGIEVLIDDRDERPGVKFKDADLIGIPLRITVGRKAKDKIVELKLRGSNEIKEIKADDVLNQVNGLLKRI
jgi:prolyl-tRNA synthetase